MIAKESAAAEAIGYWAKIARQAQHVWERIVDHPLAQGAGSVLDVMPKELPSLEIEYRRGLASLETAAAKANLAAAKANFKEARRVHDELLAELMALYAQDFEIAGRLARNYEKLSEVRRSLVKKFAEEAEAKLHAGK